MENKIEEGRAKLAEIANASDHAWGTIKDKAESSWNSLKSSYDDAVKKFKK